MSNLTFVKLGGSLITDKSREAVARPTAIRQVGEAIRAARQARPDLALLLGHGSGSFGHFAAHRSGFGQPGNWAAFAETGAAAARLNRIVTDLLLEAGLPVVSMQPSASALARDGALLDLAITPIRTALEHALIPLVFGDVALDETRGMSIASTEIIFSYLAARLGPGRILLVGALDGVFSADPRLDPAARLLPEITPAKLEGTRLAGSHGVDVTGGMEDKVRRMLALAAQFPAVEIWIVGAGALQEALVTGVPPVGTRLRACDSGSREIPV